ncbi:Phosphatidylinositol alpha-mannosyltransferase [Ruaniaceae bacterium KH17]|nr:Phosphatidylinositol alpha-mannosyltransferase [Ruaniaceae bacterium KH17]
MKIGIVCPYSWDAPGGVQFHIRDLAQTLIGKGHQVSVLAPASDDTEVPSFVVSAGRSVPIAYNGSVARLSFGVRPNRAVDEWLEEGGFDLIHIHEPIVPSLGMLALAQAELPVVATFHSAMARSRALNFVSPMVQPLLEKVTARIAVSDEARRTVSEFLGGDAYVIPNGIFVADFANATPDPRWKGVRHGGAPTVAFLGRLDEPRKGLPIFTEAVRLVHSERSDVRFLIAGSGEAKEERELLRGLPAEFLGGISDAEKSALFASVDQYVAPQTGGESFGIVLVEAMAGGSRVIASNIQAFDDVLDHGAAGDLFEMGDARSLADSILADLDSSRPQLDSHAATWVRHFDWAPITERIEQVYTVALDAAAPRHRVKRGPFSRIRRKK